MSSGLTLRGGTGVICPQGLVAPRVAGPSPQLLPGLRDVTSSCFGECNRDLSSQISEQLLRGDAELCLKTPGLCPLGSDTILARPWWAPQCVRSLPGSGTSLSVPLSQNFQGEGRWLWEFTAGCKQCCAQRKLGQGRTVLILVLLLHLRAEEGGMEGWKDRRRLADALASSCCPEMPGPSSVHQF